MSCNEGIKKVYQNGSSILIIHITCILKQKRNDGRKGVFYKPKLTPLRWKVQPGWVWGLKKRQFY